MCLFSPKWRREREANHVQDDVADFLIVRAFPIFKLAIPRVKYVPVSFRICHRGARSSLGLLQQTNGVVLSRWV